MNRLVWIVTLPVALLVILFALMNRQEVTLSLWPLPWDIGAPLFLFTLGAIVFGFLFGALTAYLSGTTTRRKLRAANRALAESQDELAILKRAQGQAAGGQQSPHRLPTALPPAA
jgi:uncharacterized integral membrane protein